MPYRKGTAAQTKRHKDKEWRRMQRDSREMAGWLAILVTAFTAVILWMVKWVVKFCVWIWGYISYTIGLLVGWIKKQFKKKREE